MLMTTGLGRCPRVHVAEHFWSILVHVHHLISNFFQNSWKTEIISYFLDTSGRASNFTNETWRYSLAKPAITLFIWSHCGAHGDKNEPQGDVWGTAAPQTAVLRWPSLLPLWHQPPSHHTATARQFYTKQIWYQTKIIFKSEDGIQTFEQKVR